jgi:hypothetical protein
MQPAIDAGLLDRRIERDQRLRAGLPSRSPNEIAANGLV